MITGAGQANVEGWWLTIQATFVSVDANALVVQTEQLRDENVRPLWAGRGRRGG
ncbi:MAG: hypothetical protein H8E47_01425 [Anaerolineales bacterium]|nr:hypothetical protein [Anaerolineales bacterium]